MDKGTALDAVKVLSTIAVSGLLASGLAWGAAKRCEAMEKSTAAKAAQTERAKADPCIQYHQKALKALQFGENKAAGGFTGGGKCQGDIPCAWVSGAVTAYSLLYQNCRDLEKRK